MDFFDSLGFNNVGRANDDELPFALPEIQRGGWSHNKTVVYVYGILDRIMER